MLAKIAKLVQLQELGFMEDITTVRWTYEATNATREAHRVDRPPRFTRLLYAPTRRCGYSPMDCQKIAGPLPSQNGRNKSLEAKAAFAWISIGRHVIETKSGLHN